MVINSALDLLQPGESAVVLFTRGQHLTLNPDGSGLSGNWRMGTYRNPDKVILYWRHPEAWPQADIYIGNYMDAIESPEQGRRIVRFSHWTEVGTADQPWTKLVGPGRGPMRYITKG